MRGQSKQANLSGQIVVHAREGAEPYAGPGEGRQGPWLRSYMWAETEAWEEQLCQVLEEEHSGQGSSSAKGLRQDRVQLWSSLEDEGARWAGGGGRGY